MLDFVQNYNEWTTSAQTYTKRYMDSENIQYQLVPPGVHRANSAERAIRTFKNQFIAGLATTDPDFPMHLWDKLVPQAIITLNLLRTSRINPQLSAYTQVFGQYNFAAHPLAPPGTHILIHEKPDQRASWAPHAVDAWYIGPSLQHYRYHRTWVWASRHERVSDTVTWLPKPAPIPSPTIEELILATSETLLELLQNRPPPHGLSHSKTMVELADFLRQPTNNHQDTYTSNHIPCTTPDYALYGTTSKGGRKHHYGTTHCTSSKGGSPFTENHTPGTTSKGGPTATGTHHPSDTISHAVTMSRANTRNAPTTGPKTQLHNHTALQDQQATRAFQMTTTPQTYLTTNCGPQSTSTDTNTGPS
jgi:hypothetical protein